MTHLQDYKGRLAHALALAEMARPIALSYFRNSSLQIDNKLSEGFDPVTQADRKIEKEFRTYLAQHCGEDSILGEEFGAFDGSSSLRWVLDPIDGTRGFMSGTPVWGVLIALENLDGPQIGVIDQPFTGERFVGTPSGAVWMHQGAEKVMQTSKTKTLADAILVSTFPEIGKPEEKQKFDQVAAQVRLTRYGLDCYGYALLALGQVDLVIEAGLNPYDVAAPIAVIQAAGGVVTNWQGEPAHKGGQIVAAATAELHAEALALLG